MFVLHTIWIYVTFGTASIVMDHIIQILDPNYSILERTEQNPTLFCSSVTHFG